MKIFRSILIIVALVLCHGIIFGAEVQLSGDARARYKLNDNYLFGNTDAGILDSWDSRVRVNFLAQADGGAYAKARLRFERGVWGIPERTIEPWIDIAYIGVPIGPVTVEGGLTKSNLTKFFQWDQSVDQLSVDWKMLDMTWNLAYRIVDEGSLSTIDIDRIEDNDTIAYGLAVTKKIAERGSAQVHLFYQDDQRDRWVTGEEVPAASGFFGSLFVTNAYENFKWESELAFQAGDTRQSRDEDGSIVNALDVDRGDGWGWYLRGEYELGSVVAVMNVGTVWNGYEADDDFGWIMIGNSNNEPITVISQIGENGDWVWIAPSLLYKMNEQLRFSGNFVWAMVDAVENTAEDVIYYKNLYELSADLTYILSDGASFTWKLGLLKPEIDGLYNGSEPEEEIAVGSYVRMQIAF